MKYFQNVMRATCAIGAFAIACSAHAGEPTIGQILAPYGGGDNITSTFSFADLSAPKGSVITFDLIGNYTRWANTESFGILDGASPETIFAPGSTLGEVVSYTVGSNFDGIFFQSNSGDPTQNYPFGSEGGLEVFQLSGTQGDVFAYEDWKLHPDEVDYNDMVVKVSITAAVPEVDAGMAMMLGLASLLALAALRARTSTKLSLRQLTLSY